jgi:hypothetical protein
MMRVLLLSCLLAVPSMAAKIAVSPMKTTAGVDEATKRALTNSLAAELNKRGHAVLTDDQIAAMLNQDAKLQWLGCSDNSCASQLGEALGVDEMALMSLSKVGQSWLVNVQRIDVKAARAGAYERRVQASSLDAVLDVLPALMSEAYGPPNKPIALVVGSTPLPTAALVSALSMPVATVDALAALPRDAMPVGTVELPKVMEAAVVARLVVLRSESGAVFAYDPKGGLSGPFFVGEPHDKEVWFFEQRIGSGGGDADKIDVSFWDPRYDHPGFAVNKGAAAVTCGKQTWPLAVVKGKARTTMLKGARFLQPKWSRRLSFVMRDDELTYVVIDQNRDDDQAQDFRMYVGTKGAMSFVPLQDGVLDQAGLTALGKGFKLQVAGGGSSLQIVGQQPRMFMGLEVSDSAALVYGPMGLYPKQLGTMCDFTNR